MKRRVWFILFSVLCGASPAWAMRAHDYIDADQRATVTLPGQHAALILAADQAPLAAAATEGALLPTQEQAQQAGAATPVVSPVPEPPGYAMLGLGLLLLLLTPTSAQQSEAIAPDPDKHSTL